MRKNFTVRMVLVALLMTLTRYSAATAAPEATQVSMGSMTVSELEKAGDAARMQKNYPEAIQYFQAAVRKDKKNWTLYNKLGMAEMKNNDLRAARSDFERAAKRNPKSAEAVNNIGAVDFVKRNYGSAAKYFKKAVALDETRATFHVNLGAAWFGQNKVDRAVIEYTRALELEPDILKQDSRAGAVAQISSPEERARYAYMLAKIYARRGDVDNCLQCLKKAKEEGYRNLAGVYKEEEFSRMWQDSRLHEVVPPPTPK
ncbi:MAG: tetratricopeptide repeat protein [Acidobacteriia bacterium]|nr:tetratricopeptide repeat protein [Terriglobia bacterium]